MEIPDFKKWLQKYGLFKKDDMPKKKIYNNHEVYVMYVSEDGYALISYHESGKQMFKVDLKELE